MKNVTAVRACSRLAIRVAALLLVCTACNVRAAADVSSEPLVPLSGHVLPALERAIPIAGEEASLKAGSGAAPLTLTVVLRRSDPEGFQRYLHDVYDPQSREFRQFLSPDAVAERFGPMQSDYDAVLAYFVQQGFTLGEGSRNRLTLTLNGTREGAERALAVAIKDYRIDNRSFYANGSEPALPQSIALRVDAWSA